MATTNFNGFEIDLDSLDPETKQMIQAQQVRQMFGPGLTDAEVARKLSPTGPNLQNIIEQDLQKEERMLLSGQTPQRLVDQRESQPRFPFEAPSRVQEQILAGQKQAFLSPNNLSAQQKQKEVALAQPQQTPGAPQSIEEVTEAALTPQQRFRNSVMRQAELDAQLARNQAKLLSDFETDQRRFVENQKRLEAQRQEATSELIEKKDRLVEEIGDKEITGYWEQRGPFEKVLAALAVGVGAYASTLAGQPNAAYQILQDAIREDYDKQVAQINKAQGDLDRVSNLLSTINQEFDSQRMQELEFFDVRAEGVKTALQKASLEMADPRAIEVANQTIAEFDMAQEAARREMLLELQKRQQEAAKARRESPGQKKVDEEFAKVYNEQFATGRISDVENQLQSLGRAIDLLEAGNVTGPVEGAIPESLIRVINPDAKTVRDLIEQVVQRDLRAVLGPQFTENEGARLIARAFDPKLSEEENLIRVRQLYSAMQKAFDEKVSAARYFVQNNMSLAGYVPLSLREPNQANINNMTADEFARTFGADALVTGEDEGQNQDGAFTQGAAQNVRGGRQLLFDANAKNVDSVRLLTEQAIARQKALEADPGNQQLQRELAIIMNELQQRSNIGM